MKLLTKHSDYAVRALMTSASEPGVFISSAEIARREGIPLRFLRILLRKLASSGFLHTREGVKGGVRLAKAPSAIRVSDIMRLFQGRIQIIECLHRKKVCAHKTSCGLLRRISVIEERVSAGLDAITISDLLADAVSEGRWRGKKNGRRNGGGRG